MKKFFYIISCTFLIIFCSVLLVGCDFNASTIVGKSAYEIAVENGFKGSAQDWLASLKGDNGANGENGRDGEDGVDISAQELFALAVQYGLYLNDSAGYNQFLSDYLSNTVENTVLTIEEVANKALLSVASIYCEDVDGNVQAGAGVFYYINTTSDIAYIITNYHVVCCEGTENFYISDAIRLYLYGSETITYDINENVVYGNGAMVAEYVGGSADYDLAVLKVSGDDFALIENSYAREVTFANSDEVSVGEFAVAVGNPAGSCIAVTSGIVSVDSEYIDISIAGEKRRLRCVRIDTPVNPGNSGGGLFDGEANLLGIVNAKSTQYESYGYALESNVVKNVVENILYYYETNYNSENQDNSVGVNRCLVNVAFRGENAKNIYNSFTNTNTVQEDVVLVEWTVENGVAQTLGLEIGDKFISMIVKDNNEIEKTYVLTRSYMLLDAMLTVREGFQVTFNIERTVGEETQTLQFSFEALSQYFVEV